MQITIDTKKDTKEEIKRAVDLLLNFVDERKVVTNDPKDVFGTDMGAMAGMAGFLDSSTTPEKKEETEKKPTNQDLGLEFF